MYSVSVLITELLHGSVSTVQKLSRDSSPPISQVLWFVYLLRSVRSVAVSINYSYQYQLSVSAASICFVVRHRYRYRYGISIIWCRSLEKRSLRIQLCYVYLACFIRIAFDRSCSPRERYTLTSSAWEVEEIFSMVSRYFWADSKAYLPRLRQKVRKICSNKFNCRRRYWK